jgi:predicted nucleic acid-binding protein
VKYLLDANVWLEAIVGGAHAHECRSLLTHAPAGSLATTDFSLHTAALILTPSNPAEFRILLDDLTTLYIFTLHLTPSDLYSVLDRMSAHHLDFDDAFQYIAAERNDLQIVSFDSDFDRTPRGRVTPAQVLDTLRSQESE